MTSEHDASPARPNHGGCSRIALAVVLLIGTVSLVPGCSGGEGVVAGAEPPPDQAGARPGAARKPALRVPKVGDGDLLYAVAGADDRLLSINPKTGSVRSVGNLGIKIGGMEDLILGPDGTAIASYWEGYPALVRIDLKTGRATQGPRIQGGSLTDKSFVEALAMIDGVLYGAASNPDSYCHDCASLLVRIDPETGRATDVGPFGPKFLNMEAMAYSPEFGLIGADIGTLKPPDFRSIDTHPALVRIDPKTGRATRIGDLPPSEIKLVKAPNNGLYLSPEGPYVCGLAFAPDGTLYGTTFPTHFGGLSELVVIDPSDASIHDPKVMNASNVDGIVYVQRSTSTGMTEGVAKDQTAPQPSVSKIPPAVLARTAFLGDSITDSGVYPELVRSALEGAGLPPMVAFNAGVGGDTAGQMNARLESDVLGFQPTLVIFSAGVNDAFHDVPVGEYAKNVLEIVEAHKKKRIPLILLTPSIVAGGYKAKCDAALRGYEIALRKIARAYGLSVAEVRRRQEEGLAAGRPQLVRDWLHPNLEGQRMIARAVLDAMGYTDVSVPDRPRIERLPGVIPEWDVRPFSPKAASLLTEAAVSRMKPDTTWLRIRLPEHEPIDDSLKDCIRFQGGSVSLAKKYGVAGEYVGVSTVVTKKPRDVWFHIGGELKKVWVNGRLIYDNAKWRGWHAGRESVAARLMAGPNTVVIATGPCFFLSVTDGRMWSSVTQRPRETTTTKPSPPTR